MKTEVEAYLKATFKKDLNANVNLQTSNDLFSNFIDKTQSIDVNWQVLHSLKVSKYISTSLSTHLIYDDNTTLAFYKSDGVTIDHEVPGTQFKVVYELASNINLKITESGNLLKVYLYKYN